MKIKLTLDKATKNTRRYAEVTDQESLMPTVYIKTEALLAEFGTIPDSIVVTVEVSND